VTVTKMMRRLFLLASAVLIVGWWGCAGDNEVLDSPKLDGDHQADAQSSCVECHTDEEQIEATTDYVPPTAGSSGAG
jgi:hypothetical protein